MVLAERAQRLRDRTALLTKRKEGGVVRRPHHLSFLAVCGSHGADVVEQKTVEPAFVDHSKRDRATWQRDVVDGRLVVGLLSLQRRLVPEVPRHSIADDLAHPTTKEIIRVLNTKSGRRRNGTESAVAVKFVLGDLIEGNTSSHLTVGIEFVAQSASSPDLIAAADVHPLAIRCRQHVRRGVEHVLFSRPSLSSHHPRESVSGVDLIPPNAEVGVAERLQRFGGRPGECSVADNPTIVSVERSATHAPKDVVLQRNAKATGPRDFVYKVARVVEEIEAPSLVDD